MLFAMIILPCMDAIAKYMAVYQGMSPGQVTFYRFFFQLVSSRYERASLIVTSNKPFGRWGEVFGDVTIAAAMIDRIVHHAEVHTLKGASYRLKTLAPADVLHLYEFRATVEVGSLALACIRPQALSIGPDGQGISARVVDKTFTGESEQIGIMVHPLAQPLRMHSHVRIPMAIGEKVSLQLNGAQIHVFPEEPNEKRPPES